MSQTKIYDRFDAGKRYDRLQFAADRVLQSAELNELQSMQQHRLRGITDVLFKEGDIVRGCQCITSADTGATTIEAGALYVAGAVRGITPGTLTVATMGTDIAPAATAAPLSMPRREVTVFFSVICCLQSGLVRKR